MNLESLCETCGRGKFCNSVELRCFEQTNFICDGCMDLIYLFERDNQLNYIINEFDIIKYNQQITINFELGRSFYKLNYELCCICLSKTICCKICRCEHYCCLYCFKKLTFDGRKLKSIHCPYQNCDLYLDHYVIAIFLNQTQFVQWNALDYNILCPNKYCKIDYNILCPNKYCKNTIIITPYCDIKSQIMEINVDFSQCTKCQTKICNKCWTQFKGEYQNHFEICNSEQQAIKLYNNYLEEYKFKQCPKCKFYSQNTCQNTCFEDVIFYSCQFCNTEFCTICQAQASQLFQDKTICFNCCKVSSQRKNRILILCVLCLPLTLLAFTFLVFYQIIMLFNFLLQELKYKIKISYNCLKSKSYHQFISFPLILFLAIYFAMKMLIEFIIKFIPFSIIQAYKSICRKLEKT